MKGSAILWDYIEKHITAVFLAVVVIAVSMGLIVVWKINIVQKQTGIISIQTNKIIAISEIKENVLLQIAAMNDYVLTGKLDYLNHFNEYTQKNDEMQVSLIREIRESRKPLARQLHQSYADYISYCDKVVKPLVKGNERVPVDILNEMGERQNKLVELSTQIQVLRREDTISILGDIVSSSKNASKASEFFSLLGLVVGIALSMTLGPKFIRNHIINDAILNTTRNITITIDGKGIVTSINSTAENFFQKSKELLVNKNHQAIIGIGKMIDMELPIDRIISSGIGVCNLERIYSFGDGWRSVLNVDCLPMSERTPCGVLIVARDISERKILEEKLYAMTLRDSMTNLYNHAYLKRRLKEELLKSKDNEQSLSYILLDIDDFKFYNDRFGHQAGDALLKEFAQLLKKCVRGKDIVGRYGGDEFAVILPKAGRSTALMLAERIRSTVEKHPFNNKMLVPGNNITVSIGVAIFPDDACDGDELIKLADEAMYRCKQNQKNGVQLYFSALKEFQKELKESEKTLYDSVKMLLGIINSKDRDTYLHLEKVAEYVEIICNHMNLDENIKKDFKIAAFLHDLGKIEIPRTILNKTDQLSKEEWSLIKQHPKWGASILRSMQQMDSIIPLILHHHERYDGNGYPKGLRGEDIPLGARIIAVADSFDAMTTSRPYRKAKSTAEAMEEIVINSGTQFDPLIAGLFAKNLSGNCNIQIS